MICKKCGNELPEGSNYCPICDSVADEPQPRNRRIILGISLIAIVAFVIFMVLWLYFPT
ncbi:MAG: zinc-ribbon domain-containing protein [Candidatus Hodarchaeota archaeon]